MCIRVETDYEEALDEASRLKTAAQILSKGVYAYLKKRGLLAAPKPQVAPKAVHEGHGLESEDSP